MNRIQMRLTIALIICIIFPFTTSAKIGYDVDASVNSSSWGIHRSTQSMDFSVKGLVVGIGTFTRLSHLQGFGGIKAEELSSSTHSSNISYGEQTLLRSIEGPVIISTKMKSDSDTLTNQSHLLVNEPAEIKIDESWPTYYANYKKISYLGQGMRTLERYENNGDISSTYLDSWKLSKESLYRAHLNRSVISTKISSSSVSQELQMNRSSLYNMELDIVGASTRLDFQRRGLYDDHAYRISQDYIGEQKMNLLVEMNQHIFLPKEADSWLPCCSGKVPFYEELLSREVYLRGVERAQREDPTLQGGDESAALPVSAKT